MSGTWEIKFDFGAGYVDYASYVIERSIVRSRIMHNNFKSVVDTCTFKMCFDQTFYTSLITVTDDIPILITRNTATFFTGIVRNNFRVLQKSGGINPDFLNIECVDFIFLLDRKIDSTFYFLDYKVCDNSNQSTSIVHQLLIKAGLSSYVPTTTINKTIPYFAVNELDNITYKQILDDLLFEFGYVINFNSAGTAYFFPYFKNSISSAGTFSDDDKNILGDLFQEKKDVTIDRVRIEYNTQDTISNAVIFSDTTNGTNVNKCNILMFNGSYYPDGASADDDVYCEYSIDGYDVIGAIDAELDLVAEAGIYSVTFSSYLTRALLKLYNGEASAKTITKLDIKGTAIVKGNKRIVTTQGSSEKIFKYICKYIDNLTDAENLCNRLQTIFCYGNFIYKFKSASSVSINNVYTLSSNNLGISQNCILSKIIFYAGEATPYYEYEFQSIGAVITSTNEKLINSRSRKVVNPVTNQAIYGLNIKPNIQQFNVAGSGYVYVNGFDNDGNDANIDGYVWFNGEKIYINRGNEDNGNYAMRIIGGGGYDPVGYGYIILDTTLSYKFDADGAGGVPACNFALARKEGYSWYVWQNGIGYGDNAGHAGTVYDFATTDLIIASVQIDQDGTILAMSPYSIIQSGATDITADDGRAFTGLDGSGILQTRAKPLSNAPSTDGAHVAADYIGIYKSGWKAYFNSDGDLYAGDGGTGSGDVFLLWDRSAGTLVVKGDIYAGTLDKVRLTSTGFEARSRAFSDSPQEGDHRILINNNVLSFYEYTSGAWDQVSHIGNTLSDNSLVLVSDDNIYLAGGNSKKIIASSIFRPTLGTELLFSGYFASTTQEDTVYDAIQIYLDDGFETKIHGTYGGYYLISALKQTSDIDIKYFNGSAFDIFTVTNGETTQIGVDLMIYF